MRFLVELHTADKVIPINYQYPLSAAIYKILDSADKEYADFLHNTGYGKGFKFFTFSQLNCSFKIEGDRMSLLDNKVSFEVAFHLPEASRHFIKGLFLSQKIEIADKKSKATFTVASVEALPNPFSGKQENEIVQCDFQPASAIVAGIKNQKSNYDFLSPDDPRFAESLMYNWREKIKSAYPEVHIDDVILFIEIIQRRYPPKSRLITIKAGTAAETKIRGWLNFDLKVIGEKRFVELLLNSGVGVYNALGCGMVTKIQ